MITWNNLDTLASFKELAGVKKVDLAEVMAGENGAERVKNYSVPMTEDLTYNYAAKAVDDKVLAALAKLAKELGLDAIHDTVHEMAKDEARHGKAFAGLLKRYFGE